MPANQPYDPRYNAKIYIPKLTEEQRRARATPMENLRRPRLQPADPPAAPSTAEAVVPTPVPVQDAPASPCPSEAAAPSPPQNESAGPSPTEAAATAPLPAQAAPAPHGIPTAREVVMAEFPELYPQCCGRTCWPMHVDEIGALSAECLDGGPAGEPPHRNQTQARPQCTPPLGARARRSTLTSKVPLTCGGPGG